MTAARLPGAPPSLPTLCVCCVLFHPSHHPRCRHYWRFLDDEPGKKHHHRPAEPPRHLTWRKAAANVAANMAANEDERKYNSFFVVGAAPSEQAFEAQVRLQRFLPRPLTLEERAAAEARKKGPRQRSRPSSAAGEEQRDARGELSFLALCVGTGILQGYLAKLGYTGEMVDDGKCASPQHGALYPRNWWHRERPLDADPFDGLELLSRELHQKGVGQDGGSARRVELKQLDTAELPIEGRKRVDVARPTRAKSRHHLPYCYHHHLPSAHARRLLLCWLGSVAGSAVKPGPLLSAGLARHVLLYPQQDVRCEAPAPTGECLPRQNPRGDAG